MRSQKTDRKFSVKTKIKKNVTCKHCVYLNTERLNGKYCSERGIIETSALCSAYQPNVHQLRSLHGSPQVIDLFQAIRALPTELLPLVASLLIREAKTRKVSRFKMLQPVVLVYNGLGDYLSDYCYAYVLDADQEHIRFINKKGTFVAQFHLSTSNVFTLDEFAKVRQQLKQQRKLVRPTEVSQRKSNFDEVIPTIDTVIVEKKISKSKLHKADLHTLFAALTNEKTYF